MSNHVTTGRAGMDLLTDGRVRKRGEAVAATIRRQIATGELKIGDQLASEETLTEFYGIGRTTLREALRILESQGLIAVRRGRVGGATVTMPDLDRLAEPLAVMLQLRSTSTVDLDRARRLIEPQLAAWLAKNHAPDDLAAFDAAIAAATAAAEANDRVAFGVAAANFHATIIEHGGNNTLSLISQLLHELMIDRYRKAAETAEQRMMRTAIRSYTKLVELIRSGKAKQALKHWEQQMDFVTSASPDRLLDVYAHDGQALGAAARPPATSPELQPAREAAR